MRLDVAVQVSAVEVARAWLFTTCTRYAQAQRLPKLEDVVRPSRSLLSCPLFPSPTDSGALQQARELYLATGHDKATAQLALAPPPSYYVRPSALPPPLSGPALTLFSSPSMQSIPRRTSGCQRPRTPTLLKVSTPSRSSTLSRRAPRVGRSSGDERLAFPTSPSVELCRAILNSRAFPLAASKSRAQKVDLLKSNVSSPGGLALRSEPRARSRVTGDRPIARGSQRDGLLDRSARAEAVEPDSPRAHGPPGRGPSAVLASSLSSYVPSSALCSLDSIMQQEHARRHVPYAIREAPTVAPRRPAPAQAPRPL